MFGEVKLSYIHAVENFQWVNVNREDAIPLETSFFMGLLGTTMEKVVAADDLKNNFVRSGASVGLRDVVVLIADQYDAGSEETLSYIQRVSEIGKRVLGHLFLNLQESLAARNIGESELRAAILLLSIKEVEKMTRNPVQIVENTADDVAPLLPLPEVEGTALASTEIDNGEMNSDLTTYLYEIESQLSRLKQDKLLHQEQRQALLEKANMGEPDAKARLTFLDGVLMNMDDLITTVSSQLDQLAIAVRPATDSAA